MNKNTKIWAPRYQNRSSCAVVTLLLHLTAHIDPVGEEQAALRLRLTPEAQLVPSRLDKSVSSRHFRSQTEPTQDETPQKFCLLPGSSNLSAQWVSSHGDKQSLQRHRLLGPNLALIDIVFKRMLFCVSTHTITWSSEIISDHSALLPARIDPPNKE